MKVKKPLKLNYYLLVIILLVIIFSVMTWWRMSELGFYSDDWNILTNTIYLPATLKNYVESNSYARPVYGLILWLLNQLADGSPAYWQLISSITVLLSAITAFKLIQYTIGTFQYDEHASRIGAFYGAITLFFSPAILGVTVWPTGVLTVWSFILVGTGYLIIEQNNRVSLKAVGVLLVLCGFLTYEAYWLMPIPFLLMSRGFRKAFSTDTFLASLWYIVPLGLTLLYQRVLIPWLTQKSPKAIPIDYSLIKHNIVHLNDFVAAAFSPIPTSLLYLIVVVLILCLLLTKVLSTVHFLLATAALTLGFLSTVFMYGAAGYGLHSIGVMSRTLAVPALYVSAVLGIFAAAAASPFNSKSNFVRFSYAAPIILMLLFAILIASFIARIQLWQQLTEQSLRVIDTLTNVIALDVHQQHSADTVVIVQIDGDKKGEVFGASWELGGAVAWKASHLIPNPNFRFLVARQGAWSTTWDGDVVTQTVCKAQLGNVVEQHNSVRAPRYYRINPHSGQLMESGRLTKEAPLSCN